jgi:Fe-S-cluster containining protein
MSGPVSLVPPDAGQAELPEAVRRGRQLTPGASFSFGCHPKLSCFTDCCSNVSILLTPGDVLSLARRTGLTTTDFLDRHTQIPITKDLRLPVVMLKMDATPEKRCPFVTAAGCSVYDARPWSCRMYPVGLALPPARAGVEPEPSWLLFEDAFCHGHREAACWTVESWQRDQGIAEREAIEQGFRELVSHPYFIGGRQLDPKRIELFHMAAYDLDRFREFVFRSSFLSRFELDDAEIEALRADDGVMLRFGFRWLRFALFGEPTVKVRRAVAAGGMR